MTCSLRSTGITPLLHCQAVAHYSVIAPFVLVAHVSRITEHQLKKSTCKLTRELKIGHLQLLETGDGDSRWRGQP